MTDRDYIRQVDALRAPDSLRADIAALSDGECPKRRPALSARWLAAAVLALAVGLGAAMPRLFPDLFTGGELHPPTATTSPTSTAAEAPAIPDGELTELLEAALPEPASASGGVSLLYSTSQSGRTLGVALCRSDRHGSLGSLVFGVFDNASKAPVGGVRLHQGDDGELSAWTDNDRVVHLLWTNYTTTMSWDRDCGAGLYLFDRGALTQITKLPQSVSAPEDAQEMLDPEQSRDFWAQHKPVLNGTALEVWKRLIVPPSLEGSPWRLEFTVLFAPAAPVAAEGPIPDDVLTNLLGVYAPHTAGSGQPTLLARSSSPEGYTMGVLSFRSEAATPGDPSGLILAAFHNTTHALSGTVQYFNFPYVSSAQWLSVHPYVTEGSIPGGDYFLCIGESVGATSAADYFRASLYHFDGRELKQITTAPRLELPPGLEHLFDDAENEALWQDRRIMLAQGGFELFRRNPKYYDYRPDETRPPLWLYECYVPMTPEHPEPRAMKAARQFWEDFYGYLGNSSAYSNLECCAPVTGTDYRDPEFPDALLYYAVLRSGGEVEAERYFLFDRDYKVLGTRSVPEFTLTVGGKAVPLGLGQRGVLGRPSKTNTVKLNDAQSLYSEWYGADFANGCAYTYYPKTGEYRLSLLSLVLPDAYTARGIHVGSTVAEVIAAYPEADTEFSAQTYSLSYRKGQTTLEFYFQHNGGLPEPREETLKRPIIRVVLTAADW